VLGRCPPVQIVQLDHGDLTGAQPQPGQQQQRSLANLAKRNLRKLTAVVKTRLKRMQYRPGLLDSFLASTHLDLTSSM
jgi:hypothetical protein